jgi:hypothetical protein
MCYSQIKKIYVIVLSIKEDNVCVIYKLVLLSIRNINVFSIKKTKILLLYIRKMHVLSIKTKDLWKQKRGEL